ncbi:HNH endonuclease signature motif containing protein [Corynebacterium tuberculostearicum]|uniref:HNH endonuclease signature motif containing protein n=1 Tax=Corynebacterium tuberculostearicum TaxID=38304 RepID=UPI0020261443|nr:HNH endonuclease signature motif containing protein [Corynebacterium tuberculostearicum]MCG7457751.1 HNH endonuclease [Corynebacterium tuberculostearicum]
MTALDAYLNAVNAGMDIVAAVQGLSDRELIARGASDIAARDLLRLCDTYFGRCGFAAKQRAARQTRHSLDVLLLIEKYALRLPTQRDAWTLRTELCAFRGSATALEKRARALVRELRPRRAPEKGVRITRRSGGPWSLTITGDSADVADMHAALDANKPLESAKDLFFGKADATRATVTTQVVLTLDELDRIVDGGGEEITLQLTNGARITGAELVARTLSDHGYVTLVHPHEGPVNLYRTSRVANDKQRLMAAAVNPVCPWESCNYPADKCQIHHLKAWKHGGETNAANLATCCPYHNGVNDDDPNAPPRRGRLARVRGQVTWVPPWG